MKGIKQIVATMEYKSELPFRIEIGGLRGAGSSPVEATLAALSVGKLIPPGMRNTEDAIEYLHKNFKDDHNRTILINILRRNKFNY